MVRNGRATSGYLSKKVGQAGMDTLHIRWTACNTLRVSGHTHLTAILRHFIVPSGYPLSSSTLLSCRPITVDRVDMVHLGIAALTCRYEFKSTSS